MENEHMNNARRRNGEKSRKKTLFWTVGILVFMVLIGGSGFKGYNFIQDRFKAFEAREDSIIADSQRKQDSLVVNAEIANENALQWRSAAEQLEIQNYKQYETIRKKERMLRDRTNRDTSFINNARIISKNINRYHQERDTIE